MSNIENAVKFGIEEAPKHQYNPLVTYWDFDRWSIKAYAEVIINLTDGYNQIYGEPTTVIDSTLSGLGSDYFASRIIVYKNKRTIVYFDRLVHYIIPFDAISSCQPLDLSQQKISGGGFERKSVIKPTVGFVGNKLTTLFSEDYIYNERPTTVYTEASFGVELSTNNMSFPTLFLWMGENGDAVSNFLGIMNIIFSDEKYKLSEDAVIEQENYNLADLLCVSYPNEIQKIIKEHEDKEKKKEEEIKKRKDAVQNSGCMVTLIALLISTLFLFLV